MVRDIIRLWRTPPHHDKRSVSKDGNVTQKAYALYPHRKNASALF